MDEKDLFVITKNHLGDFLNATGDPIFVKDIESRFVYANNALCSLLCLRIEDIVGKTLDHYLLENEMTHFLEIDRNVIDSGLENVSEESLTIADGKTLTIITRKTRYIDNDGNIFLIGVIHDISKRKETENQIKLINEQLTLSNVEKDKLFSVIAHDLKSPFTGFLGCTELLADDLSCMTLSEIKDISSSINKSASNLYQLLENLLDWSKVQRGIISMNPKSVPLKSTIIDNINLVYEASNKKWIDINIDIPDNLNVFVDINMFKSIIHNITFNAVKFTKKRGVIEIKAEEINNKMIDILIKDSGIGMSQNIIDNLFKLNVQTGRLGTEGELSSGLGLILCKDFVEKLGGEIWVNSTEGLGSEFHFTIPKS